MHERFAQAGRIFTDSSTKYTKAERFRVVRAFRGVEIEATLRAIPRGRSETNPKSEMRQDERDAGIDGQLY